MVDSKENYNFDVGVKGLIQGDRLMQCSSIQVWLYQFLGCKRLLKCILGTSVCKATLQNRMWMFPMHWHTGHVSYMQLKQKQFLHVWNFFYNVLMWFTMSNLLKFTWTMDHWFAAGSYFSTTSIGDCRFPKPPSTYITSDRPIRDLVLSFCIAWRHSGLKWYFLASSTKSLQSRFCLINCCKVNHGHNTAVNDNIEY